MRGSQEAILDCTSQVFDGMITLNGLEGSWGARWQRLEGYQPGVYAVKGVGVVSVMFRPQSFVAGSLTWMKLPDEYISAAQSAGVNYVP